MESSRLRKDFIKKGLQKALEFYGKKNQKMPGKVIIYRDAIGGPSMIDKCYRIEIPEVLSAIESFTQGKNTKLLYCFVN